MKTICCRSKENTIYTTLITWITDIIESNFRNCFYAVWLEPCLSSYRIIIGNRYTSRGGHSNKIAWLLSEKISKRKAFSPAGLGGSVGCAVRMETRRSRVQPPPRSATFFRRDWSWNISYGHSLPCADSRRAVVSFRRKNVHNTG